MKKFYWLTIARKNKINLTVPETGDTGHLLLDTIENAQNQSYSRSLLKGILPGCIR